MSHQTSWMDRPMAAQRTVWKILLTLQVGRRHVSQAQVTDRYEHKQNENNIHNIKLLPLLF